MEDRYRAWVLGQSPLPATCRRWPLYGAGFENLGRDEQSINVPLPEPDSGELLVRHDACGLCFSDTKVIGAGEDHPRIYRDMRSDPVILGHEVSLTVMAVGEGLEDRYQIGDRFTLQADIFVDGVGYAYGYEIDGGLSEYALLDSRVLDGDDGCYLIPVQSSTGYAEAALTEPWACVVATYGLRYRTTLRNGGTTWIHGTDRTMESGYEISHGLDHASAPARILLTDLPAAFTDTLRERASVLGIEVTTTDEQPVVAHESVDDIILLGADADLVERLSPALAHGGIMAVIDSEPLLRPVALDIGRIHYNRWLFIGGTGPDPAAVHADRPVRSELKAGGRALFIGAGGPMGRMHVQRALSLAQGPSVIVATDVNASRLADLKRLLTEDAAAHEVTLLCLDPNDRATYEAGLEQAMNRSPVSGGGSESGFDDIIVLAPVPRLVEEAAFLLAPDGVMNIFAGVPRGTTAAVDLSDAWLRGTRIIGHSASTIEDMRLTLERTETGALDPGRSVAAIGSLEAAKEGLTAVRDGRFTGKIIIYPHIHPFPLTPLSELAGLMPEVSALLRDGREWTVAAEREFLKRMLRV